MCNVQVLLVSQNLKLESLKNISVHIDLNEPTVIVSTQYLFDYERHFLESFIKSISYYTFSDLLTDEEMSRIDQDAYLIENKSLDAYYEEIKVLKNKKIIEKLEARFHITRRVIASDDLGIDEKTWTNAGYDRFRGEYYYNDPKPADKDTLSKSSNYMLDVLRLIKVYLKRPVYSACYGRKKYVFYGELYRVIHRMNSHFKRDRLENVIYVINLILYKLFHTVPCRKRVIHLSTLHEHGAWQFFPVNSYRIQLLQDGYLPPNYSSLYLKFIMPNTSYLAYDYLGTQIFRKQGIPVSLLPFRKKLYLPLPHIAPMLKNILIVTSGAGDWTAVKNRSDEDKMAEAFVTLARQFPDIHFIYRCHPVWIHPDHQGVNSINRIAEYFQKSGLTNLQVSRNIPMETPQNFCLSIPRYSLDTDLKDADLVIGEHSVSILDAGFKRIPFASFNVTGRRNFFCGISDMGFPHFESVDTLKDFIDHFSSSEVIKSYQDAVKSYNNMINREL